MMGISGPAAHAGYEMLNQRIPSPTAGLAPTGDNSRVYRDALGRFGTGVTVVTTATEQGIVGMTVNSFASVSLTPALVLWSISKSSGRFPPFDQTECHAIHVLSETQANLASQFARNGNSFDACDWHFNDKGVPLIENTLACFECSKHSVHDAGDHVIIVAEVERFRQTAGEPLIFANGNFGSFVRSK